jgi:hypothetical protein
MQAGTPFPCLTLRKRLSGMKCYFFEPAALSSEPLQGKMLTMDVLIASPTFTPAASLPVF